MVVVFSGVGGSLFSLLSFSAFSSTSANPVGRVSDQDRWSCPGPGHSPGFEVVLPVLQGLLLLILRIPKEGLHAGVGSLITLFAL